jgi:hypothetical protein
VVCLTLSLWHAVTPQVAEHTRRGKVLLVLWAESGPHALWERRYEQRLALSHAALALSGTPSLMLTLSLDEYLVTSRPPLQQLPVGDWIAACAGGGCRLLACLKLGCPLA